MVRKSQLDAHAPDAVNDVSFFQLIRTIERETGMRVGGDLLPAHEPIVLKADPDAHFAASEVCNWNKDTEVPEVRVSFFGLFGPSGALPQHYTQVINDRARERDFALRDFLDLFNHRLLSFFYRCWEKHQFPVAFETSHFSSKEDSVTGLQRALIGLRTEGLWNQQSFPASDLLYFVGHLANRRPSASAITSMVHAAFDVPVELDQFVGQIMLIDPAQQTQLGREPLGFSIGNQLGSEAFAGQRVWDFENKFRLRLGPLPFKSFQEFNPGGSKLRELFDFVRFAVGPQYDVEVQVVLRREDVVTTRLNDHGRDNLGWNTWLGDWPHPKDADEPIFQLTDFA